MTAPHVVALTKLGFNSISRTVSNFSLNDAVIDVYDNTASAPFNKLLNPVAGAAYCNMSFSTELNPSGSAAGAKTPPDGYLLRGCWFKQTIATTVSTTYALTGVVADYTAATISKSLGNLYLFVCTSALGSVTLKYTPNAPIMCDWNFGGTYTAPAETALSDAAGDGGAAPVCIGTCTVNSDTVVLESMTINVANSIKHPRYDMAATNGVAVPLMGGQICTAQLTFELPAMSTENYITDLVAGTAIPVSVAIGSGAGYVITTTFTGYQTGVHTFTNSRGILAATLNLRMGWDTGEPLSIAFT
jgi:hypothetical protein